jgi:hypothetical protein
MKKRIQKDRTPDFSTLPPANRKYKKKTYENRPDRGPTTRCRAAKLISPNVTTAEAVRGQTIRKMCEEIIECHTI